MDEPASAHDLTLRIGKLFGEAFKNDVRKTVTMDNAIDTTDELISEHERAILEAAAERACDTCSSCDGGCMLHLPKEALCPIRQSILEPITKEKS